MTEIGLLIFQSSTLTDLAPSQRFGGCRDFAGPFPSVALDGCFVKHYSSYVIGRNYITLKN